MIEFVQPFSAAIFDFFSHFVLSVPFLMFSFCSVFCVCVYGILGSWMRCRR